jgi:hypothetical protein
MLLLLMVVVLLLLLPNAVVGYDAAVLLGRGTLRRSVLLACTLL